MMSTQSFFRVTKQSTKNIIEVFHEVYVSQFVKNITLAAVFYPKSSECHFLFLFPRLKMPLPVHRFKLKEVIQEN